jgi:hypothetical protein
MLLMMAALQLHLARAVDVQNGESRLSDFLRQVSFEHHFIVVEAMTDEEDCPFYHPE